MNNQRLYLSDQQTMEFTASIEQTFRLQDGRPAVILDRSYFYPAGGGQECDTGQIGEARVVEVFKQGDPAYTVHVLDQELPIGSIQVSIDGQRRMRNSQVHTAQHLLSACFLQMFKLNTVSVHLKGDSASSLDLDGDALTLAELKQIEVYANQIIWENRTVRAYFVSQEELEHLNLRGYPAAAEDIRLVEIAGIDLTPCGGTHVEQTGSLGLIKILKAEHQGKQFRIWFVAGEAALQTFQLYQEVISDLTKQFNVSAQDLPVTIERQADTLKETQQALQALKRERLGREAEDLASQAQMKGKIRFVQAIYPDRAVEELRFLGDELSQMPGIVATLATVGNERYSLVVACSADTGQNAAALLSVALSKAGGRGGGSAQLAQGGGPGTVEQAESIIGMIKQAI